MILRTGLKNLSCEIRILMSRDGQPGKMRLRSGYVVKRKDAVRCVVVDILLLVFVERIPVGRKRT